MPSGYRLAEAELVNGVFMNVQTSIAVGAC